MMGTIWTALKFCSWVLVISSINFFRYLYFKNRLNDIYAEHKEGIHKAIRCDEIKFSSFLQEPLETGNDMLDLLLFKIHRSAMWSVLLLFFYIISVLFFVTVIIIMKKTNING